MPNLTGKLLGKVHVDMFLAKGGMAEVYLGTHTTLHRSVAVKFLKADLQGDPELLRRFEREARVIAMLRHPNIVQIFDFDSYANQPYLVMEYVPGASLSACLRHLHTKNERLDHLQILKLLKQLADALTYAHQSNVIHRDVKPANILLTSRSTPVSADQPLPEDVEPVLTDFGLVRFTQSNMQTSTGVITGTPAYMSPEQARGDPVDTRTDVYSLGITVYEMLAGRVPFEADSTLSVLHMQIYDPPPPIDGLSRRLQEVMDRALAKDPQQRFQTPLEFASTFEAALTGTAETETINFPSALSRSLTATRENLRAVVLPKNRKFFAPLLIGATIALLAIGSFLILRTAAPSQSSPAPNATIQASTTTPITAPASTETHQDDDYVAMPTVPPNHTPGTFPSDAEPVGLLHFQDGSALADQVTFTSSSLPPPPQGRQYQAWLVEDDGESLYSIGIIQFDGEGRASLIFVDDSGRNLIGLYHGMQLTLEPNPDNNPNPSNQIAYSAILPAGGYSHVRHLLAAFGSTPDQTPFVHGLVQESGLLNDLAQNMLDSFNAGDEADVRLQAELMLNLILGTQSPDHKDWNGDGTVNDPSDGYGMLLNGSNSGYIQGTFTHANLSATSDDATENMLIHGEHVKVAATNVSEWTPLLRDQLIVVLESPSLAESEGAIRQAVVLADRIRNGVDVNGNENIEAIPGEGGAMTAYDHALYMADIFLKP